MLRTSRTIRLASAAATAVAVIGLAACSSNDHGSDMSGMHHGAASAAPSMPSPTGSPATGPHNQADVMFAMMMIPHHQQAVEMSDVILAKDGVPSQVTKLATQIKAAQAPEIATMSGWLASWGQSPSPSMSMDHGMGHDMGGMMSQAEMDALQKANGTEAARLFLTGMITHHEGAIDMAKEEIASGQNPAAKQLAESIVSTQQAEITTMKKLLEQL